jgi:hypothetical protein
MNKLQQLFLYFLVGCIGARLLLVYLAKSINIKYLPYLGYVALLPVFGILYIYFFNGRKSNKGVFGEDIWWQDLRPVHATTWFLFAIFAIMKKSFAWIFLLVDVVISLVAFLTHHYRNGDISKVFS